MVTLLFQIEKSIVQTLLNVVKKQKQVFSYIAQLYHVISHVYMFLSYSSFILHHVFLSFVCLICYDKYFF